MHHGLKFYSRFREHFLKYYIFQAKWTRLPVIGRLVRTIAIAYGKSRHSVYLLSLEQANEVVGLSTKLALGPCSCRRVFRRCDNPARAEILIGTGVDIFAGNRPGEGSEITKQEAWEVLTACHEKHLLHTLVKCGDNFYALCNCCSCCCVPLRLKRDYGIGTAFSKADNIVELFSGKKS